MPCFDPQAREEDSRKLALVENMLCGLCTRIEEEDQYHFINKDPILARWWAKHQEKDRLRQAVIDANRVHAQLLRSAARKLTQEERQALGIRHQP